jgi:hypothetical protein
MFTSRTSRVLTIPAALVIAAVTAAESTGNRAGTNNSAVGGAAQADTSGLSAEAEAGLGKALAGTWIVTVDQPGFPLSQRHFTFSADGGLITNDDLQVGPNFVEHFTIAQGNWIRTGPRSVAATIVGQRYTLEGSFLGTFKVRMNLVLNQAATRWNGVFRITIALPNGFVVFTSDGTSEAARLEVEPL